MLLPYLRSLLNTPLAFIAYFQGELHLRGRFIPGGVTSMSACDSHLMSPIVNKGESFDSSSFALGSEWCEIEN